MYASNHKRETESRIYFDDQVSPSYPTSKNNYLARTTTTNYTAWNVNSWTSGAWHDSPSIQNVLQELVNSYGDISVLQCLHRDFTPYIDEHYKYFTSRSYDASVSLAPKIHIEYEFPTLQIITPSTGFLLQESTVNFLVYATLNPISVQVKYTNIRYDSYNNTPAERNLCTLNREGSSDYYSADYVVNLADLAYPLLANTPPPLSVIEPEIKIVATYSGGTIITASQTDPLCGGNFSFYQDADRTFWCYGEFNPILSTSTGYFTDTPSQKKWCYNCMAYALDQVSGGWLWPDEWEGLPTNAELTDTMTSYGYTTQSQSIFAYAQVIYYTGGHFSKVTAWDSTTGMPIAIKSKWGGAELIISSDPNPFRGTYGSHKYYFAKP